MNKKVFFYILLIFTFTIFSLSQLHAASDNNGKLSSPNEDASFLHLVPFPKQIQLQQGEFDLKRQFVIGVSTENGSVLGGLIADELDRTGFQKHEYKAIRSAGPTLCIFTQEAPLLTQPDFYEKIMEQGEFLRNQSYLLRIEPDSIVIQSTGEEGLVYGVQTLCQLIRANRRGSRIPCLSVQDWPSIGWRAYQDDLTRGPSTQFDFLKRQIAIGSNLKMNIFTYYMEYQYAHAKHPKIGPEDGSLTPEELRGLVEYGAPLHMNIMGNQQSFAHFEKILAHEEYAPLRENSYVITPAKEETYQFLDDLYADQIPYLPFPFFNICGDETAGIGDGPAKEMVEKYGVAGTYVKHIQRVYDLVKNKYEKRMMMWGDIILNHPDHLKDIPKDVIMMTWGYDARDNFEDQIIPFAKSGFDFFVCPGGSSWSVILPNFQVANKNIQNFIRDGYKHGCLGALITNWDDDGRTFNAVNIYEYAWNAECAWNASATSWQDFNRRVGRVLFGQKSDDFGHAIELLLPVGGTGNPLFFNLPLTPFACDSVEQKRIELKEQDILKAVRPALVLLKEIQENSNVNGDLLDYFIFGAERLELIAQREIDRFEAAVAYKKALDLSPRRAKREIAKAAQYLQQARDAHLASRERFIKLWNRENKPYALSWAIEGGHPVYSVKGSYNEIISKYDSLIWRLSELAETGDALPPGSELGLGIEEAVK